VGNDSGGGSRVDAGGSLVSERGGRGNWVGSGSLCSGGKGVHVGGRGGRGWRRSREVGASNG